MALTLNLLSIAVLAFIVSTMCIAAFYPAVSVRLKKCAFSLQKCVMWLIVTTPWWVAISCVIVFWPSQQVIMQDAWLSRIAHWHHTDSFHLFSWHAATLCAAILYTLWMGVNNTRRLLMQSRSLHSLLSLSANEHLCGDSDPRYYSLASSKPVAFTAGLLRPKVYISTALQQLVSAQQLDIIIRHERAHVSARDPFYRTVFSVLSVLYPSGLGHRLIADYLLLTEQIADDAVAKKYDNLDVAQTLIDVARAQQKNAEKSNFSMVSYFGQDQITKRVERLISPCLAFSKRGLWASALLITLMPLVTATSVDSLHHIIETFFTH